MIRDAINDNPVSRWWGRVTASPDVVDAGSPWNIGIADWGRIVARSMKTANGDDYGIVASSIAFAAFLSLLPLLGLVAALYGLVVPHAVVLNNISTVVGLLPDNSQAFVQKWLTRSLARQHSQGVALAVSMALTLFSARRVGRSLIHGLNIVSGVEQPRGPLATQLMAIAIVLAGAVLLLGALLSVAGLAIIRNLLPQLRGIAFAFKAVLWFSLTLGPAISLLLIYRYAPAHHSPGWRWALPGVAVALVVWLAATFAFRFYVSRFASYDSTYGSLSAIIVLQLWLMLSAYILMFGARVNVEAERQAGVFNRNTPRRH